MFLPHENDVHMCGKLAFRFWQKSHSIASSCEEHWVEYEKDGWEEITQDEFDTIVFLRS
jgi:hypothetical protein